MAGENTDERDDVAPSEAGAEGRSRGFRLTARLRPLSNLLGNLIEVTVSEPPPPSGNPEDLTAVDENGGDRRRGRTSERKRIRRGREAESGDYLIDTRFDDDELLVTADVPGASKHDLSVGIDPNANQLVIGREGTVIGRVDLPWPSPETTSVWFNNGVLEVRMRPSGGTADTSDSP